jgi:acyl-CoA thioester hydrolase
MKQQHSEHPFTIPVRVYYEDTDAAGVVYYANYLRYFERARTEWLRAMGRDHADLGREHGLMFVVRSVALDYLKPARLDDLLTVGVGVEKLGRAQVVLRQFARRGDEELVTGTVNIVCVDIEKMKSAAIPDYLRETLKALQ